MKIIPVVGKSNSGKTTFLEKLIPEIKKRGYKLAVIKHDVHGFEMDHEGKDTYRLKHAGADSVLISSPAKFALIEDVDKELELDSIANAYFADYDLVLTEGYKKFPLPKIEVFRSSESEKPLCVAQELILLATDTKIDIKAEQFSLEDVKGIVDFLEHNVLDKPSRAVTTRLRVNGQKVPIKSFVQDFIAQSVAGMVGALNNTEKAKHITLEIDLTNKKPSSHPEH